MTRMPDLWLADLRGDGTAAFRRVSARAGEETHTVVDTTFAQTDYSAAALATLRQDLHRALVNDGLFADEAQALLDTWQASYFKAAGQRLFFLVPATWTDRVLPLKISVPATVKRAMMGRIELVSPAQRQALQQIAAGPVSDRKWFDKFMHDHISYKDGERTISRPGGQEVFRRLFVENERGLLDEKKTVLPDDYRAYLSLGRFRDALLWDAQRRTPDPEVARFLRTYVLTWVPVPWQAELLAKTPTAVSSTVPATVSTDKPTMP